MKRRRIYIGISLLIMALIVALIAWAIFIGRQQQELQGGAQDLGYFGGDSTGGTSSSGNGLFGGIFNNDDTSDTENEKNVPQPVLRQLYSLPTAGYIKKRANAVRFVDRATGHVFEKDLPEGVATRIDQTTIPQVYTAVFTEDGDGVVRQYLTENNKTVSVYSNLAKENAPSTSLPATATHLVVNSSGDKVAYLDATTSGSKIILANPDGKSPSTIFSSALRGWNVSWRNDLLFATQKSSGTLPGSSYILNTKLKTTTLALQQYAGLITNPSADGSALLYSTIQNEGRPLLSILDIHTGSVQELNISGFADKCVWNPSSTKIYCALPNDFPDEKYPDAWYQGSVHFSDSVWKIDVAKGTTELVLAPKISNGVSLDMYQLSMDARGETLFFINKTDQTFWSIALPELQSL